MTRELLRQGKRVRIVNPNDVPADSYWARTCFMASGTFIRMPSLTNRVIRERRSAYGDRALTNAQARVSLLNAYKVVKKCARR